MVVTHWHTMSEREHIFARRYSLSPSQARIFCALHDAVSYVPNRAVHSDLNTRKVLISTLRKKVDGYKITNIHGRGYQMELAA